MSRQARVFVNGIQAAVFDELVFGRTYRLQYDASYQGPPVSLTLPVRAEAYEFEGFPPFFDGLLPEGMQLEGLLRLRKLDKNDLYGQLMAVGADMVGAITVQEIV